MNFGKELTTPLPRIGYALVRVSTGEQSKAGVSLEAQTANITRWALVNRIRLMQVFTVVGSGRNMEAHAEYRKLMRLLKRQRTSQACLVVNSVDRFSRNSLQGSADLNSLLNLGISFVSVTDGLYIHTSRSIEAQRFVQLIQAAETESIQIETRVRGANKYLASLGWQFGPVPIGKRVEWVNVDRTNEGLPPKAIRTFVPDKAEENIINFVMLNYNSPENLVTALGRRTFRGERITDDTIQNIRRYISKHRKDELLQLKTETPMDTETSPVRACALKRARTSPSPRGAPRRQVQAARAPARPVRVGTLQNQFDRMNVDL